MRKIHPIVFIIVVATLFAPDPAAAQGLANVCDGPNCSSCHIVDLANNLIQWLIGIVTVLFAVLMTVAGFGLVTSGGNPTALTAAKSKFVNAMIGFMIVLAAWLLVDTIMRSLVGKNGDITGWGFWADVQCFDQTVPDAIDGIGDDASLTPDGLPSCGPSDPTFPDCVSADTPSDPTAACTPLSPLTGAAVQMESGSKVVWTGADPRLRACAMKAGGSITSAYRPPEYQAHLREVHTKWCSLGLNSNTDPACAAVKSQVQAEMSRHGLSCSRPVARNSNHSTGIAVDISGAPQRNMPENCLSWFGLRDPVHYTLISGCSCN